VTISSPIQQVNAIVATRDFLLRLTSPAQTRRVPGEIRREARALLRHYPVAERLRPLLETIFLQSGEGGSSNDAKSLIHDPLV
jgi:hypothetical protein